MEKKSSSERHNNYLKGLSKNLEGIFHNILVDSKKALKLLPGENASSKALLESQVRKIIKFESRLESVLQLYSLDLDAFALTREPCSLKDEVESILNALRRTEKEPNTIIESKIDDDLPIPNLNKNLFQKWLSWCINHVYANSSVIHVSVEVKYVNDQIIIRVIPKRFAGSSKIVWDGINMLFAEHYFQLENGNIKQLSNHGIEIVLTAIAKHSIQSGAHDSDDVDILKKIHEEIDLPTLSPIATKVIRLASDSNTSAQDIADVVTLDPALTAKLLKVVNSPLYGFQKEITTLSQAITLLGMKAVRTLSLCISIMDTFPADAQVNLDYNDFWQRSLASAIACKLTAQKLSLTMYEEAFIAGLTQNVGCLMFERFLSEKYAKVYTRHNHSSEELAVMEEENWGIDHAKLGYELFIKWKMPLVLAQTILYHHNVSEVPKDKKDLALLVKMVNVSDLASKVIYNDEKTGLNLQLLKDRFKEYFNLDGAHVDDIMEEVTNEIETVAGDFDFKIGKHSDYAKILQTANIELGRINLDYEQINRDLLAAKNKAEKLAEELRAANKKLEEKAVKDGLTNLYNHRFFFEVLNKEFANARRSQRRLSCIMLDIDFFKNVNDTYGHQEGDKVLKMVGKVMLEATREGDVAARYGGEEFAIILPDTPLDEAFKVAERIRKTVEETHFTKNLTKGRVTVSVGVADTTLQKTKKAAELAELADRAVYMSKKTGRNKITIFSREFENKQQEVQTE